MLMVNIFISREEKIVKRVGGPVQLPEENWNREVVYAISKQYSCRGYTTTAVKGLIKYLFENTDVELLNTVVLPHNLGSNKVIQKCGFRINGEIEIEDQIHFHYTLNKEDWKEREKNH